MPLMNRTCRNCGREFRVKVAPVTVRRGHGWYCSKSCGATAVKLGKPSRNWRGGKTRTSSGHVIVYQPDHPDARAGGRVLEHRLVMERILGRRLRREEVVHHINGNPADNRHANLQLLDSQSAHMRVHHRKLVMDELEWRWYMEA